MNLSSEDFERAFGGPLDEMAQAEVDRHDFSLVPIVGAQRDSLLIEIIDRIRSDTQIVGAENRKTVWESGWKENAVAHEASRNEADLVPRFIRRGEPVRWQSRWYQPANLAFEESFTAVLRTFIFGTIDRAVEQGGAVHVHEFGAGTGWNLVHAHKYFQERGRDYHLFGSDFVDSSVELLNRLSSDGIPLTARKFDMLSPDYSQVIEHPSQSGVFTLGALEQLAGNVEQMFDYLIDQMPAVVVNVEPAIESYDNRCLEDYLASWFQGQRGYTEGLEALLREKESQGKIDLLRAKRIGFGSKMMEGYNLFVWSPVKQTG